MELRVRKTPHRKGNAQRWLPPFLGSVQIKQSKMISKKITSNQKEQ